MASQSDSVRAEPVEALRDTVIGWDIGGAHVKASLLVGGRLRDAVQWACPLWEGLDRLDAVLAQARSRWPGMAQARHAVTMTGEMADLFASRAEGVACIAERLAQQPGAGVGFWAGEDGFIESDDVSARWEDVASANWLATATLAARSVGHGLLVDIGSTTCDLIPLLGRRPAARGRSDAQRLVHGELVYQGVVRTPLCALARRIDFEGVPHNVMNEFFATTADVYRLLGELDPAHDQHPAADHGPKDALSTRRRLARMVGRDADEGGEEAWADFARAWRAEQLLEIGRNLDKVLREAGLPLDAPLVSAGCGCFLVEKLAALRGRPCEHFAARAVRLDGASDAGLVRQAQVCAPAVAVGLLLAQERG
ncbi:hydantoinase/oxoprolinase family protein [Azohydromonas aeria]|uniref:hydantoinase/oxoprolinase family protein n=1 Tax=Azohydromonas aeria TaxID=2590212 RepID=UPI0012F86DF1|nr:hydantoinase/oxoprolinase family protein [Azohydromonas aeria]